MDTRERVAAGLGLAMQKAVAMTTGLSVRGTVAAGLGHVKKTATAVVTTREGAAGAAALAATAVGAYFLLPAAAPAAAMMKAPGAAGFVISRAAFLANPQLYFHLLRTAGAKAAVAAFVL